MDTYQLQLGALQRDVAERCADMVTQAADLAAHLKDWLEDHPLRRSVLLIDDSPPALCALVAILAPLGVAVHAVTDDPDCMSTLCELGATPHLVSGYEESVGVWKALRSAVVVVDLHLGDGVSGLDILGMVGRGPRCIVVTSHSDSRISVGRAAGAIQAEGIVRTMTGAWEERLRDGVDRLLMEASSKAGES